MTPWTAACQASLSFIIFWSLLKLKSVDSVVPSNHLILCHPLFLLPLVFPSIRVFSSELIGSSHQMAKVLVLQHQCFQRIFRVDFLLGLTGLISSMSKGLKSLLQDHSVKASILRCSTFFMVQLSDPHMTTGKATAFNYTDLCQESDVSAF